MEQRGRVDDVRTGKMKTQGRWVEMSSGGRREAARASALKPNERPLPQTHSRQSTSTNLLSSAHVSSSTH
jgi:hypothetical protein